MKKIASKILLLILAMTVVLSATGCKLFFKPSTGGGGELPPPVQGNYTVEFNELSQTDRIYDRMAAINKVMRANVAIIVENSSSISYGSGTIVDVDLMDEDNQVVNNENEFYIITCYHVVSGQGEITVAIPDKNSRNFGDADYDQRFVFTGIIDNTIHTDQAITLVGGDSFTDIAVLKLDISGSLVSSSDIVEAKFPVEDYSISYAEELFVIGNTSGSLPMSISQGIVSYLERLVLFENVKTNVIQITAHATHGNSGCGVYNYYGELIGMVNGGSDTYLTRFAIPFKSVYGSYDTGMMNIAKQLIESKTSYNHGYVSGRWNLGFSVKEKASGLSTVLKIESVVENSNAYLAGLQAEDTIVSVTYVSEGKSITTPVSTNTDMAIIMAEMRLTYKLGDTFTITVKRASAIGQINTNIEIELIKQFIFCDTGVYSTPE